MSDLHLDITQAQVELNLTTELIDWLNNKSYDVLIIAGDLAGDALEAIKLVEKIKVETSKDVYFVAGNHDVWVPEDKMGNSWSNYHLMYNHSSYLKHPITLGNHVVIGGMGWYDYSFGQPDYPNSTFKSEKKKLWKDALYARWDMDDEEVLNNMLKNWEIHLEEHRDRPVLFVNHFVPYKKFLPSFQDDERMNFCRAYMGSEKIGQLLDFFPNVDYVVFGHTHKRQGVVHYHGKKIICNPLGYVSDWVGDSFVDELDKVAVLVDL